MEQARILDDAAVVFDPLTDAYNDLRAAVRTEANAAQFAAMAEAIEDIEDEMAALIAYTRYQADMKAGRHLAMPREQWQRIRGGESPLRVVREFRGLTQAELAEASGIARPEISAMEGGKRRGTVDTFKALAAALQAPMDVLVG